MAASLNTHSRTMHVQLYGTIGEYLPPRSDEFKRFFNIIPLTPRDKHEENRAEDLLQKWETRGGNSIGRYDELLRVLREADLGKLVEMVEPRIAAIQEQLALERRTESNPVACTPDPPHDEVDGQDTRPPPDYMS